MANHKSAAKRHRQSLKKRERNRTAKGAVRTAIKAARAAIEKGDKEQATTLIRAAERVLSKAASKGILNKYQASRRTSRLAASLNSAPNAV